MKAKTTSRRKRGRPPLPVSEREPNGKLSRRKSSIDNRNMETNMNIAVSTRIRQQVLVDTRDKDGKITTAVQHAMDQRRGYVLGLMLIDNSITQRQHDAGQKYAGDMARFYGMTGIAFPTARGQALATKSEVDEHDRPAPRILTQDERHEAAEAAEAKRDALVAVLRKDPLESFHKARTYRSMQTKRAIEHAVNQVCLGDVQEARTWPEHMHVFLRKGLNLLADYYGTTN